MLELKEQQAVCQHMVDEFSKVTPNTVSLKNISQVGFVMKCFYQLYNNEIYHSALEYSFGLNGYLDNLNGVRENIEQKRMSSCKFKKGVTKFVEAYFPALVDAQPVKNTYKLNKHLLITGPNAAGKTTLLKTTIFNIIISQQLGYGFYQKANVNVYDRIHCYINIPDTSARDSLFQAEAKRCKDILNQIHAQEKEMRHFCVFDELYSGTNPYEAISSACAYLNYLNKYPNVNFVLTTHYMDLCRQLDKEKYIHNCHMLIETANDDFKYTYKIQKGISNIKGGVKVLKDLDYPLEIIENTKKALEL
jgi:DNA mismatch repair ATPase MutS